jgi:hypothetical protein
MHFVGGILRNLRSVFGSVALVVCVPHAQAQEPAPPAPVPAPTPPTTDAPATETPTTDAPATEAPTTAAPATATTTSSATTSATTSSATSVTAGVAAPRYTIKYTGLAGSRGELVSAFPVDRDGNTLGTRPGVLLQARAGATIHKGNDPRRAPWMAEAELDVHGMPIAADIAGSGLPYDRDIAFELRRAYARFSLSPRVHLLGGAMTNHWGMGLVSNDGAHGWTPESARFADPVSGDRVGRAAAMFGPFPALGGTVVLAGGDYVLGDDVLLDDRAVQGVAAVQVGVARKIGGGVYVARRHQWTDDGYTLDAWVVDGAFRAEVGKLAGSTLAVEGEGVVIFGDTSLAPTMDYASQDVMQLGGALRATMSGRALGGVLDLLFATGDQNAYDDTQHGFRPDPNYDLGLLLYRVVLAGQSGRGAGTAGDPGLVGYPAQGVERIPTRGSATNTFAVFPRAVYQPIKDTVVYGGPLLAFAPVTVVDPFASRIGGSSNRNALGGNPGTMLGVEVDVGVRHQRAIGSTRLSIGLEAGALFPGDAFADAMGQPMDPVWGGRLLLQATR